MKQTITETDFIRAFHDCSRGTQFSHAGLVALYDYLTELEEDCGIDIELDVIALCCEFTEFEDWADFTAQYGDKYRDMEHLRDYTMVIPVCDDGFIIQDF